MRGDVGSASNLDSLAGDPEVGHAADTVENNIGVCFGDGNGGRVVAVGLER